MINLKIILESLKNGKCEPLYKYDQFIMNKFFEYALNDKEYISNLENLTGFENMKQYNPKHDHLLIIACKASINLNNIQCYKIFYKSYLEFKSNFMAWRGRLDWFYFHKVLFSHFIWHNDVNTLLWTWKYKMNYAKNFRKKYSIISDWRRKWYIHEIKNIRCYIIEVCILSDKTEMIKTLVDNQIIKITKYIEDIFIQYGYKCNKNGIVSKADFYNSPEWNYICYRENDISIVNLQKCIYICSKSNCNKDRIFEILSKQSSADFWTFFKDITVDQLKVVTSKQLSNILKSSIKKFNISNQTLQYQIIIRLFELFSNIKQCLIFDVYECVTNFKLDLDIIYNIICKLVKECGIKTMSFYNNLKLLCDLFLDPEEEVSATDTNDDLSFSEINVLYSIFGNRIKKKIKQKLKQIKRTKPEGSEVCPICLDNINDDECVLFCGHRYHKSCIKEDVGVYYIKRSPIYRCPICRCEYDINLMNLFS